MKRLLERFHFYHLFAIALLLALPMMVLLSKQQQVFNSHAAGSTVAVEAENGTVKAGATIITDTAASGQRAIQFGAAIVSPQGCALPAYPRPDCTGVPAGTVLTELPLNDGSGYRVTQDGTVIDGKHIKGYLLVTANNVTIKNSQIDGTINNEYSNVQYKNTVITDSTIGSESGCVVSPGIQNAEYTATRVRLRGTDDGFRAGGPNVTVRDSYVKNCGQASSHGDGIQDYPAVQNLIFDHNTMDLCGPWTSVPTSAAGCNVTGHNSPIFIHSDPTHGNGSTNVRITNNLAMGGVFTLYLYPTYGSWIITGNRVVNNTWDFGSYETEGQCSKVTTWADNTIVTIDASYKITSTVKTVPCQ